MSTTTKATAELERPLEVHELDVVSGGGIPVQQPAQVWGYRSTPGEGGPFYWEAIHHLFP
jgi:hypothetical protein